MIDTWISKSFFRAARAFISPSRSLSSPLTDMHTHTHTHTHTLTDTDKYSVIGHTYKSRRGKNNLVNVRSMTRRRWRGALAFHVPIIYEKTPNGPCKWTEWSCAWLPGGRPQTWWRCGRAVCSLPRDVELSVVPASVAKVFFIFLIKQCCWNGNNAFNSFQCLCRLVTVWGQC